MKKIYASLVRVVTFVGFPISGLKLHNSRRVRVLLQIEDQVLLQKTSVGHQKWSVPGGGIEKGENPIDAAIREVKEEVGIIISEEMLTCVGEERTGKRWPKIDKVYYSVRLASLEKPVITRPLEILEAKWFRISEIPHRRSETIDRLLSLVNSK